nr:ATP-binding cassette domain-containing protein [Staphylospora marina]
MRPAIETRNLTKAFDGVTALNDVNLIVPEGSVFGLVGPSGAGKTTLIRLLTGVLRPTSGTARLLGRDAQEADGEIRQQVGMVPDDPGLIRSSPSKICFGFVPGSTGTGTENAATN